MLSYQNIINKIDQLEEANILISAFELRIFSILEKRFMTAKQIANASKSQLEGIETLLNALAAMGALKKKKDKYKNTQITYKNFCKSSPYFKKGTIMLKQENRREYEDLAKIIKNGRDLKGFAGEDDSNFRQSFTYAMHERSDLYANRVAEIATQKYIGRMIDLGCGPGSYSAAILKRDKTASAVLMDRFTAIQVAKKIHKNFSAYRRLKFISGDLFEDDFGGDYNTVFLSNILHIYNFKENQILFKKIYAAMKKGGRFLLYDLFLKDNKTEPYDASLFAITMLLYTKTGKSYTFSEAEALLKNEGFVKFKKFQVGHGTSIIEAIKD